MIVFKSASRVVNELKHYFSQVQNKVTDWNTGSVIMDFFNAIGSAIGGVYILISNVYNASFVATAEADDLDNIATNYTLFRRASSQAEGVVTFFRSQPTLSDIIIPLGTLVRSISTDVIAPVEFETTIEAILPTEIIAEQITFYSSILEYNLVSRKVFEIEEITGTFEGNEGFTFEPDIDYTLNTSDASQATIVWRDRRPDDLTLFFVTYVPLSVDISIVASSAGAEGNIIQGSITHLVNRINGIESVYNYQPTMGGTDPETDFDFRARIPMFLSSLSKGVENSIRSAALAVSGVQNCRLVQPDPPNGFITLYIDDGSGSAPASLIRRVKDKIDGTLNGIADSLADSHRAIGIGVNVIAPSIKEIFVNFQVRLAVGFDEEVVRSQVILSIGQYLMGLSSGTPVIRAEMIKVVMQIDGVENIILNNSTINGLLTDIQPAEFEVCRLRQAIITMV